MPKYTSTLPLKIQKTESKKEMVIDKKENPTVQCIYERMMINPGEYCLYLELSNGTMAPISFAFKDKTFEELEEYILTYTGHRSTGRVVCNPGDERFSSKNPSIGLFTKGCYNYVEEEKTKVKAREVTTPHEDDEWASIVNNNTQLLANGSFSIQRNDFASLFQLKDQLKKKGYHDGNFYFCFRNKRENKTRFPSMPIQMELYTLEEIVSSFEKLYPGWTVEECIFEPNEKVEIRDLNDFWIGIKQDIDAHHPDRRQYYPQEGVGAAAYDESDPVVASTQSLSHFVDGSKPVLRPIVDEDLAGSSKTIEFVASSIPDLTQTPSQIYEDNDIDSNHCLVAVYGNKEYPIPKDLEDEAIKSFLEKDIRDRLKVPPSHPLIKIIYNPTKQACIRQHEEATYAPSSFSQDAYKERIQQVRSREEASAQGSSIHESQENTPTKAPLHRPEDKTHPASESVKVSTPSYRFFQRTQKCDKELVNVNKISIDLIENPEQLSSYFVNEIKKYMEELKKEINGLYPRKDLKREKFTAFYKLFESLNKHTDLSTAIRDIEKDYPNLLNGVHSKRAKTIIESIKQDIQTQKNADEELRETHYKLSQ